MTGIKRVTELSISQKDQNGILWRAQDGRPFECCGLVLVGGGVVEYQNTYDGDRRHAFSMDVEIDGIAVHAVWHSHPEGPPWPSAEDEIVMKTLYEQGYQWPHFIAVPGQGIYEYSVVEDDVACAQAQ